MVTKIALIVGFLFAVPLQVFSSEEQEYFPLGLSRAWFYECSKKRTVTSAQGSSVVTKAGTVVDIVTRLSTEFKAPYPVFVLEKSIAETDVSTGNKISAQGELHYSNGGDGVLLHGRQISGVTGHSDSLVRFNPPQVILKLPLSTMPQEGSPADPRALFTFQPKPKAQSFESVRVKAGTFENCLKVEFEGPISGTLPGGLPIKSGTSTQIGWYAKGVGLVKLVETRVIELGMPDGQTAKSTEIKRQELVKYSTGQAAVSQAVSVRKCYEDYKKAILDQKGTVAVELVDEQTLLYYGRLRKLALEGEAESVRRLSTVDRLMVLMLRHLIPAQDLETMTAKALFVYAVDQGWIGRESVIHNELGHIVVLGSHATGVHIFEGKESDLKWSFRKEEGRWRINLTSLLPVTDQAFKAVIREMDQSEDEFIFTVLESVSGRKVGEAIWDPMTRRKAAQ